MEPDSSSSLRRKNRVILCCEDLMKFLKKYPWPINRFMHKYIEKQGEKLIEKYKIEDSDAQWMRKNVIELFKTRPWEAVDNLKKFHKNNKTYVEEVHKWEKRDLRFLTNVLTADFQPYFRMLHDNYNGKYAAFGPAVVRYGDFTGEKSEDRVAVYISESCFAEVRGKFHALCQELKAADPKRYVRLPDADWNDGICDNGDTVRWSKRNYMVM